MDKGNIYFEIQADDINRAINFYTKVFDWKFSPISKSPIPYWRIITGKSFGGLFLRTRPAPTRELITNAFICSFQVLSIDETASIIMDLGGEVFLPKFAVSGLCWQGYFLDKEGNIFGLFQADENAK